MAVAGPGSLPVAALGQSEEQVLQRRQFGGKREDADSRRPQCERERADVLLVGLEAKIVLAANGALDTVLGA